MFVIWTSGGGPLQYFGLGLFLLQMLPRMLPDLTSPCLLALVAPPAIILAILHIWQQSSGDFRQIGRDLAELRDQIRIRWNQLSGVDSVLLSLFVGAFVVILLLLDPCWLAAISQLFALGVGIYTHLYGPVVESAGEERASRDAKMKIIAELVQAMPVENFVPEEHIHKKECSVAQLKNMLKRRGLTDQELESFVDRQNLEETLAQRRKYSDTCCICVEPYEVGEPLRVLPNCHHELHLECVNKWAFTFASASKRQHDPSCPLCKAKL